MKTRRRQARTLAFQTLFELESRPAGVLDTALKNRVEAAEEEMGEAMGSSTVEFAARLVRGTSDKRQEIDDRIARVAPAFPIDQLPTTDRVALELAIFEMLYERRAPFKVVINEAVELAKTYGGDNSGRFVNGVLGTIAEELPRLTARGSNADEHPRDPAHHNAVDNTTSRR
jgi:N utilization substance protein B